jgi:hypothetical protein
MWEIIMDGISLKTTDAGTPRELQNVLNQRPVRRENTSPHHFQQRRQAKARNDRLG